MPSTPPTTLSAAPGRPGASASSAVASVPTTGRPGVHGGSAANDAPSPAVLARFGLDLTTLSGLNEAARRAEEILDQYVRELRVEQETNPQFKLDLKALDAATKILCRLVSVRKTLSLLARLPERAPDPTREQKRLATTLRDSFTEMDACGLVSKAQPFPGAPAAPRGRQPVPPQQPSAPPPPRRPDREEQLTLPVPHPPAAEPKRAPSTFEPRPVTGMSMPAPPRICPTLDLSNHASSTSAFAWTLSALLQAEALFFRPTPPQSLANNPRGLAPPVPVTRAIPPEPSAIKAKRPGKPKPAPPTPHPPNTS